MKKENTLDFTESSFHAVLDIISDGIWDWNANTGFVYRNDNWYKMLGYDPHSLENTVFTWEGIIHKDDYPSVMKHFDDYISGKSDVYDIEYRCRTKNGGYIWIEDRAKIIACNPDGSVARMIGAHRDINDRKILLEQLAIQNKSLEALVEERTKELIKVNAKLAKKVQEVQRLAETDSLTGVANRYRLEKVLNLEVARAHRFNLPLSVVALDIDDFKAINDKYGHATGDMVLIHMTKLINDNIREIDLLARWGGDEFMIVLPGSRQDAAYFIAKKLQELLSSQPLDDNISNASSSFGIAELKGNESAMRLSIRADNALYLSKDKGKNQITLSID